MNLVSYNSVEFCEIKVRGKGLERKVIHHMRMFSFFDGSEVLYFVSIYGFL